MDEHHLPGHEHGNGRYADRHADVAFYGWSEDKARQYSVPERADFGTYIREKGFSLK